MPAWPSLEPHLTRTGSAHHHRTPLVRDGRSDVVNNYFVIYKLDSDTGVRNSVSRPTLENWMLPRERGFPNGFLCENNTQRSRCV